MKKGGQTTPPIPFQHGWDWNKIIVELQPQSSKQNYLLRLGLWGNRNNKSWKEAIGFDEVCLCLAKNFSFLRDSWKCLQNIPGLVLLLKYSSVFYFNSEGPNSSLRYACKYSHINQKNCLHIPQVREVSRLICALLPKEKSILSTNFLLFTQIHANFVFFQHGLGTSCSHPTGGTNIFHEKPQWLQKDCLQSAGCIRTVKMGNLILWFMRNDEEVGRAARKNGRRH